VSESALYTAAMPQSQPYVFSVRSGASCTRQFVSFQDFAEKLKMDIHQLMLECNNGHAPPSRALVKRVAKELKIEESFLQNLADEVRRDFGVK
jgi:hypothetical protein